MREEGKNEKRGERERRKKKERRNDVDEEPVCQGGTTTCLLPQLLGRLRQQDPTFRASLGNFVKPCLKSLT
jgi:hypothetical protein